MSIDTIQRVSNGIKRYILTMIDTISRNRICLRVPSKNTKHTAYALEALIDGISSIKN